MTKYTQTSMFAIVASMMVAGPALAGDPQAKAIAKVKTETAAQAGVAPVHVNDTLDELLQSNGDILPENDNDALMANGNERDKDQLIAIESDNEIKSNAIVVPTVDERPITTVSCPVGTTAQSDMTCLITGNYMYGK